MTDDGAEQRRELAIEVTRGGRTTTANVPTDRFSEMSWVIAQCGPSYIIAPGNGSKDHLRAAIQELSPSDLATSTIYSHTGWREIGGQWAYLHAGGDRKR